MKGEQGDENPNRCIVPGPGWCRGPSAGLCRDTDHGGGRRRDPGAIPVPTRLVMAQGRAGQGQPRPGPWVPLGGGDSSRVVSGAPGITARGLYEQNPAPADMGLPWAAGGREVWGEPRTGHCWGEEGGSRGRAGCWCFGCRGWEGGFSCPRRSGLGEVGPVTPGVQSPSCCWSSCAGTGFPSTATSGPWPPQPGPLGSRHPAGTAGPLADA